MNQQRKLYILTETRNPSRLAFVPTTPFRCKYILLWFSDEMVIKEITIANTQQLVDEIPGTLLASPVAPDVIQECFDNDTLNELLEAHNVYPLQLDIMSPEKPLMITHTGVIYVMALYGVELV